MGTESFCDNCPLRFENKLNYVLLGGRESLLTVDGAEDKITFTRQPVRGECSSSVTPCGPVYGEVTGEARERLLLHADACGAPEIETVSHVSWFGRIRNRAVRQTVDCPAALAFGDDTSLRQMTREFGGGEA